jgi:adenosine deaminase
MQNPKKVIPISAERLPALLQCMPKAELHIHIEGSLEPELMFELAQRNQVAMAYPDVESLRQAYVFDDLQSFLDIYHTGTLVLRTEQDFYDMTRAYLARAAADNVVHAEIFFDTQTHTGHGLSTDVVVRGLHRACVDARTDFGISAALILCFLRHLSEKEAFECLEQALPHRDKLIGVGLASSEMGHPPEKFSRVFARARELGFRLVAHAGEEGPPAYIWSALDALKVERIDHGIQAVKDPALMARLVKDRIALTVCPLSNIKLRVFPEMSKHNLGLMMDAGIVATVNSDDPSYFGGYINENFCQVFAALNLSSEHAYQLAKNSFGASFIDETQKRHYIDLLNATFETFE